MLIKPREEKFYELFAASTRLLEQGASVLQTAMADHTKLVEAMAAINNIEKEADAVNAAIVERLNQTFITPLDREDIYALAQKLDDILDYLQGIIERMVLYKAGAPSPGAIELAVILGQCTVEIKTGFSYLSQIKKHRTDLLAVTANIVLLEQQSDHLYRQEVAVLFETCPSAVEIIKWKEVLEHMETAVDLCEDVADLLKGVVLKYV